MPQANAQTLAPELASTATLYMVLDWDGTVTVRDTQWMLLERFGDRELFARMEGALGTTHTYREVMEAEVGAITAPLEEAVSFLVAEAEIRAGFRSLAERFRPLILSSGFHETIEPILAREGVSLEVVANRLDARPDGWRVLWADDAPCPECGDLCKRRALPTLEAGGHAGKAGMASTRHRKRRRGPLVYVGDGWSDQCAARAADRVFARSALADYFDEQGLPFEHFETFDDVAAALS